MLPTICCRNKQSIFVWFAYDKRVSCVFGMGSLTGLFIFLQMTSNYVVVVAVRECVFVSVCVWVFLIAVQRPSPLRCVRVQACYVAGRHPHCILIDCSATLVATPTPILQLPFPCMCGISFLNGFQHCWTCVLFVLCGWACKIKLKSINKELKWGPIPSNICRDVMVAKNW